MVTMFSQQQAQSDDILKPGHWRITDWDANVLVVKEHLTPEHHMVLLLNDDGEVVAHCSWYAGKTEKFSDPIRLLRDSEISPEDEAKCRILRYVATSLG
jgi:hypothetical protein